jgi:hypothetical protein
MKAIIIVIVIILINTSCNSNDTNATASCTGVDVSFTKDVATIITTSCATNSSCHATGSKEGPGPLTTYAQVFAARNDIQTSVSNGSMPRDGTLTSTQRNNIVCWIRNGAANN